MSVVEVAACLAAAAFAVLVGFLVPVLIRLRNTAAQSEQLLAKMNADLPALVSDLRSMSHNLNALTDQMREGVEHASVLLHAVGEVGESVQQVHDVVRGSSGTLLTNVASLVAGVRAATRVMRERYRQEGEPHNGA
ncbi:MAG TPA: DUF948 domain-containing protein [Nitrospira sp.]|jgi:uncharacterized protein YoxC|nr:DUF948 domain-containing protein [Nitrospira sp.]